MNVVRATYRMFPEGAESTAQEILERLAKEPYRNRWVAVPVGIWPQEMRRQLQELGRTLAVPVETRTLGARSILVRVREARR